MSLAHLFPFPGFDDQAPRPVLDEARLRAEVRIFVRDEIARGTSRPGRQSWTTFSRGFSRNCAAAGYT